MSVIKRTFSLPDDVSDLLNESVPNQERSKFITLLISNALKKRKINALLEAIDQLEPEKTQGESIVEVIRRIRQTKASH